METPLIKDVDEARDQLADLLAAAERGRHTIITRHGEPVAALVPLRESESFINQRSLLPLAGSGRGLWGPDSRSTLRKLRDEWSY